MHVLSRALRQKLRLLLARSHPDLLFRVDPEMSAFNARAIAHLSGTLQALQDQCREVPLKDLPEHFRREMKAHSGRVTYEAYASAPVTRVPRSFALEMYLTATEGDTVHLHTFKTHLGLFSTAEPLMDKLLASWGIEDERATLARLVKEGASLSGDVAVWVRDDGSFQVHTVQRDRGLAVESVASFRRHFHLPR
eukprot:EG_transcript_26973